MERDEFFTKEERELLFSLYKKLLRLTGETLQKGDCRKLKKHLIDSTQNNTMPVSYTHLTLPTIRLV